jgi:predicted Zn-dependent protease with MMP-like domain
MDAQAFEEVVRGVIDELPEEFRPALENLAIVVVDEPDPRDINSPEYEHGEGELLGLYYGTPLTERGSGHSGLPDRIEIYRGPILRSFHSIEEIVTEIRRTLIHELGHHMGLDDDRMPY